MEIMSLVSPRFEFGSYKGQDVVHQGVRIPLGKEQGMEWVLQNLSRNTQRIIANWDQTIEFKDMVNEDLSVLREMWFDPKDTTFPSTMDGHLGITAIHNNEIVGGVIWTQSGKNLFLHQLIAGKEGKRLQISTLLIWESVKRWYWSGFNALDIGVSYNPKRYKFFKNFAVETYPVILKKPFYVPVIRLSPFKGFQVLSDEVEEKLEDDETFFPRASYALYGALKHIGVGKGDEVVIVKTFGSDFISGCVTSAIEATGASWRLRGWTQENKVKAVVVVHEFGIPVYQQRDLNFIEWAHQHGVPVIEDCAWMWRKVFDESEYAVCSLQKIFNMNYGGLLKGAKIPDDKLWEWGVLDTVKRDQCLREIALVEGKNERKNNWKRYNELVKADGMTPDDCYDYEEAIESEEWMPTVYMQKFETEEIANDIVKRLEEFGIQAGRYWGENVVYLPIHQSMSIEDVEYMFAVVRGYFNLCRNYV